MVAVGLTVGVALTVAHYKEAIHGETERLRLLVETTARLIDEDGVQFFPEEASATSLTPRDALLRQCTKALERVSSLSVTTEFTLAERDDDAIVWLLELRDREYNYPQPVALDNEGKIPMQRALRGESGWLVGPDYRGETVVAAYCTVGRMNWGLVAKTDLTEIRQPFVTSALGALGLSAVPVILGLLGLLRLSRPIMKELEAQSAELLEAFESVAEQSAERNPALKQGRLGRDRLRLELALDESGTGSFEWDLSTNAVHLSRASAVFFGLSPARKHVPMGVGRRIIHRDDLPKIERQTAAFQAGTVRRVEEEFRLSGSGVEERWLLCRASLDDADAASHRVVGVLMDVTAIKEAEAEAGKTNRILAAIRSVNFLITTERDSVQLLTSCCKILGEEAGFAGVRIGRRTEAEATRTEFGFGLPDLDGPIADETLEAAIEKSLAMGQRQWYLRKHENGDSTSGDDEREVLVLPVMHMDWRFAFMLVDVAEGKGAAREEISLLEEVCADIGLALFMIDAGNKKEAYNREMGRLRTAIEQCEDSIVLTDLDGTIEFANRGFETVNGYSREEALGKNTRILKSGLQDSSFYGNLWGTISAGKVWRGVIKNRRKNGEIYTAEMSISPVLDGDARSTGYVAVQKDVSRALKLEAQLRQAQKMEAIGTLAGGIAHDFNNILTGIMGYAEIVSEALGDRRDLIDDLARVIDGGFRAKQLVNQILTFSRITEEDWDAIRVDFVLQEALQLLRSTIPSTATLTKIVPSVEQLVMAAPSQIHQIVMNL